MAEALTVPASSQAKDSSTNGLRLNFRGVPLAMALERLAQAAGWVLEGETHPSGTIAAWSDQPLSREEALDLLTSALLRNGYVALRRGETLTVVRRDEARTQALPVRFGADPKTMAATDEVVTHILPVRFVEVAQLLKDLEPLLSGGATMTANESANTLVITDTGANVRRLAQVVLAIDNGAENVTIVRVFRLRHAEPEELAEVLAGLFPKETSPQGVSAPFGPFGGMPGPPGFGPPGALGSGGSATTDTSSPGSRIKKSASVTAVADRRTGSIVVTAPRDYMGQIERVVEELDRDPAGKKAVAVYRLKNASAQEALTVLQDIFQKDSNSRATTAQTDVLSNRSTTQAQQQNRAATGGTSPGGAGAPGGAAQSSSGP